ncbi:MAG TPA: LacI family DNA-binding transcriptional regulator [Lysobacter sp.]
MTKRSRPTSFDIAYRAGVSQATVSRVLRGGARVSEETRRRVEAVARELDYRIDRRASALRTGRTGVVALLLFETTGGSEVDPLHLALLVPISRACRAHRQELLVEVRQPSDGWHLDYADPARADGLVLLGDGDDGAARGRRAMLQRRGMRLARVDPRLPAGADEARQRVEALLREVRGEPDTGPPPVETGVR